MSEAINLDRKWHAIGPDESLISLQSSADGISESEASLRLEMFGENRLEGKKSSAAWQRLKRQLTSILIIILLVSAVLAAFVGAWLDAGVILAVVIVNTLIGYIQEGKAERAIESIREMLSLKARVVRQQKEYVIDASSLVPGDIVIVKSGDRVPADMRLLHANNLQANEATLTGESVATTKEFDQVPLDSDLGDRRCMLYSSTMITKGTGKGVVVSTGKHTEVGRISTMLEDVHKQKTPLLRKVDSFAKVLSYIILAVAVITFVVGYLIRDYGLLETFLAALSMAVAAIPEGLPAIMTITLALGVRRMAGRRAIIRRLPAVETLGSVTVICSDKTGTLTRNEMTLKTIIRSEAEYLIDGVGYTPRGKYKREGREILPSEDMGLIQILRASMLCSDANLQRKEDQWVVDGDPTEGALVVAGLKAGLDRSREHLEHPRVGVIPFDSKHKFMATLHKNGETGAVIFVKGAPDVLIEMCTREQRDNKSVPLDSSKWRKKVDRVASSGQRTLGIGYKRIDSPQDSLSADVLKDDLIFLGIMGMIDPPREEAIRAVDSCRSAGVAVKMITGDHSNTAKAVARQMHIGDENTTVMVGRDIEKTDNEELRSAVKKSDVFARSSPEHKLRLVQALQASGDVVAMTGDGVNDAPSLKQADIGIAMGKKGTDAAREVSEMVLADDNFASIVNAIEEGRGIYDNLRKTLIFILPTNVGQAMTILAAISIGLALPLRPVHVLWVNMVVAVTLALALAFEPIEKDVMQRKPRDPGTPLITPFLLWRVGLMSGLLIIGTLGHFLWEMEYAGRDLDYARTAAINTLVVGQVFYLFNSRYILRSTYSFEGIFGSRAVWTAIGALVILQASFNFLEPMRVVFSTVSLEWSAWFRIIVFGFLVYIVIEVEKFYLRAKDKSVQKKRGPEPDRTIGRQATSET